MYFMPLFVGLLAADQLSKSWALKTQPATDAAVGFHLSFNDGIIFGFHLPLAVIYLLTFVLLVMGVYMVMENNLWKDRFHLTALALIASGAIGNLIDRIVHGHVVDFLKIYWWPTFNLADVFIVVGVLLFVWIFLVREGALENL